MDTTPFHTSRPVGHTLTARYRAWPTFLAARALTTVAALIIALALVGAPAVSAAGLAGAPTNAGRAPGGDLSNPVVRRVDVASPAIVRLATIYQAHISLALCGAVVTLPTSGAGYVVGGLGSGAFISAHGDILTAGHVVNIDRTALDQEVFQGATSAQDIANALNAATCIQFSSPIRAVDVQNGEVQFAGIPYTTSYSAPQRYAWRDTSYTGPITRTPQDAPTTLQGLFAATPIPVTAVAVSDFTQDDVAVLHANVEDTPSVTLDNSNTVAVLDTLTVIGFPGNGDATYDPTNLLTPSVNTATVSAIKENDDGSALIQVGGNIEHGDSGGPALDANGNIVGVVSFGGSDTQGITAFLRSSNSALTLIQGAAVNTTPGAFERRWQQAFADYAATSAGHWHKAARELDALASAYPDFHGVTAYKTYADQAATHETLPSTGAQFGSIGALTITPLVIGVAAAIVLLLLTLLVFALARRGARGGPGGAVGVAARPTSPLSAYTTLPSGGAPEYRPVFPPNPGFASVPLYPTYGAPGMYSAPLPVPFGAPGAYSVPLSMPFAAPNGQAAPGTAYAPGYPAPSTQPIAHYSLPSTLPAGGEPLAPIPGALSMAPTLDPDAGRMGAPAPSAQPLAPRWSAPSAPAFTDPLAAQAPGAAPQTEPPSALGVETRPVRVVAPETTPLAAITPATIPLPAVTPDTTPLPIFPVYGARPAEEETAPAPADEQPAESAPPATPVASVTPVMSVGQPTDD